MSPYKSNAQAAAMHAAAEGKSTVGIPKSVGKKYVEHGGSTKNLPKHTKHQHGGKRGK